MDVGLYVYDMIEDITYNEGAKGYPEEELIRVKDRIIDYLMFLKRIDNDSDPYYEDALAAIEQELFERISA